MAVFQNQGEISGALDGPPLGVVFVPPESIDLFVFPFYPEGRSQAS
jgi:hypothetical protein